MEDILGTKSQKLINLKDFVKEYRKLFIQLKNSFPPNDCNIQEAIGLVDDDERYSAVQKNCSINLLRGEDDNRISKFIPGFTEIVRKSVTHYPMEAMNLKTLQYLLKSKSLSHHNPLKRTEDVFKMVQLSNSNVPEKHDDIQRRKETLLNQNNDNLGKYLKIYVRVYRPPRVSHLLHALEKPVFAQEIVCLGTNYLSELRDRIDCICNRKHFYDVSEDPLCPLPDKLTDPAYFFITDTFYNDSRNPANDDYSFCIRKWAETAQGFENVKFKCAKMQSTQIIDLNVSLGTPLHYLHHGNCEHWFVFSQLEIITDSRIEQLIQTPGKNKEEELFDRYPFTKSYNTFNKKLCNTCGLLHYMYVVIGSNRQLHDPAYLCSKCFLSYHYVNGQKVGQFKAYRINDSNDVVSNYHDNDGVSGDGDGGREEQRSLPHHDEEMVRNYVDRMEQQMEEEEQATNTFKGAHPKNLDKMEEEILPKDEESDEENYNSHNK